MGTKWFLERSTIHDEMINYNYVIIILFYLTSISFTKYFGHVSPLAIEGRILAIVQRFNMPRHECFG